jgi:tRNA(His) 5'-end guanylyltransferase
MLATAKELLKHFNPVAVFTCSDEITLVFPATVPQVGSGLTCLFVFV